MIFFVQSYFDLYFFIYVEQQVERVEPIKYLSFLSSNVMADKPDNVDAMVVRVLKAFSLLLMLNRAEGKDDITY